MINLLPPENKQEIIYGRKNRSLLNWISAMLGLLLCIFAITILGQFYIKNNVTNLNRTIESTKKLISDQNLEKRQADISAFANNLTIVNNLLKDQLLFSKIITTLGEILPAGVTVSNIDFASTDSTLKLQLNGANQDSATQGYINITGASNKLISKADLESVDCSNTSGCVATVTILLNKDSEFYFLNDLSKKAEANKND